jgi:hypothetical protein
VRRTTAARVLAQLATAASAAGRTDIPFVTIHRATSRDLDQPLCLRKIEGGYRVHYAIADVTLFVPHSVRTARRRVGGRDLAPGLDDLPPRRQGPIAPGIAIQAGRQGFGLWATTALRTESKPGAKDSAYGP